MNHRQIIDTANELAGEFSELIGFTWPAGFRFDRSNHPRAIIVWEMAKLAFERIAATDVENALAELADEEEGSVDTEALAS